MKKSFKSIIAVSSLLIGLCTCSGGGSSSGSGQGGGCLQNSALLVFQAEDGSGAGQKMPRSNANNQTTVLLKSGDSRTVSFAICPGANAIYNVRVRYSNDNFGSTESVTVNFDDALVGRFSAQSTGTFGQGWNNFVESSNLGPVTLAPGNHRISISVSGGDGFGIEIDSIILEKK